MQSTLFLGICLLSVLSGGNVVGTQQAQSQSPNKEQQWKDPTTLRARVEREKAKGVRKVVFPSPLMEYPDEISLETAIARTTIVVADVLDKQSRMIDPGNIATFYKLGIIEKLSEASHSAFDPKDQDFPGDLHPLESNEMYFAGIGGTIMLDDVEVTVREDFEDLQVNGRYLFFLSATESGKFSLGKIGPRGVFRVAGDGYLDSRLRRLKLGQELEVKAGNSLTKLKTLIQKQNQSIN